MHVHVNLCYATTELLCEATTHIAPVGVFTQNTLLRLH
jgi:hypothetical protein